MTLKLFTTVLLLLLIHSGSLTTVAQTNTPISHVIIIVQENHSFDNIFGTYPTANGTLIDNITSELRRVNGIPTGVCLPLGTGCIAPYYANASNTENPVEGQTVYENDWDNGRMDGFAINSGPQSLAYFDYRQLASYWAYAEEYGLADNYFASALSTTTPNRLMMLAGDTSVSYNYGPPPYIPYNQTILSQLSTHDISWGYFDFLPPFEPNQTYPINYLAGTDSNALSRVQNVSIFLQDLQAGENLPSVNFVNALGALTFDEHPPSNVTAGELWAVSIINAVMGSAYWNSTAIFLTYDEGGGYYDHVPPPQLLSIDHGFPRPLHGYGERVPLLVISPFAKENYVSNVLLNHMSILRFIDYNWNLDPLNQNVANSNNLLDFFYFDSALRLPIILGTNGAYSTKSYPLPIQIPLNTLPYSRSNSTISGQPWKPPTIIPIAMLSIPLLLAVVAVAWRKNHAKHKTR